MASEKFQIHCLIVMYTSCSKVKFTVDTNIGIMCNITVNTHMYKSCFVFNKADNITYMSHMTKHLVAFDKVNAEWYVYFITL